MTAEASNPYVPSASPPGRSGPSRRATTGQRVAGAFLVANAILVMTETLATPLNGGAHVSSSVGIVSSVFDLLIGLTLVAGVRALAPLAIVRAAVGMVILAALRVQTPFAMVMVVLVGVSLLLLLIGEAGKARIATGSSIFGLYALITLTGLASTVVKAIPFRAALLALEGDVEPNPVHKLKGDAYPYILTFPGDAWHMRKTERARKDQPLADRWIVESNADAHVVVIVERAPEKVLYIDAYTDAVIEGAKRLAADFTVTERRPLKAYPEDGRFLRATFSSEGTAADRVYALVTAGDRAFQVIATAPRTKFASIAPDLERIVDSFRIPPETWSPTDAPSTDGGAPARPSVAHEVDPAPAGEVTGIAQSYRMKAPNDHWHLALPEATKKQYPLADRWLTRPDRDAHVIVIAEHEPGAKLPIEAYADVVESNAKRTAKAYTRLLREPMPTDPEHGRLLHTNVTTAGGVDIEYLYALFTIEDRGFQVIGFTQHVGFSSMEGEIRAILDSFRLPALPAKKEERRRQR